MDDPTAIIDCLTARIVPEPTFEEANAWWDDIQRLAPHVEAHFGPTSPEGGALGVARSAIVQAAMAAEGDGDFDAASLGGSLVMLRMSLQKRGARWPAATS